MTMTSFLEGTAANQFAQPHGDPSQQQQERRLTQGDQMTMVSHEDQRDNRQFS